MSEILQICGWCPKGERVTVLNAAAFRGDSLWLNFDQDGTLVAATRGMGWFVGRPLQISHGICEACKKIHFGKGAPVHSASVIS
jgi:hypothetical protein